MPELQPLSSQNANNSSPVHLDSYLNPPTSKEQGYAEKATTEANVSKEVARCSGLLRQMYALELTIWGMEENVADEKRQRGEMKKKGECHLYRYTEYSLYVEVDDNI